MAKRLDGCPKCGRLFAVNLMGLVPDHACMFSQPLCVDGIMPAKIRWLSVAMVRKLSRG